MKLLKTSFKLHLSILLLMWATASTAALTADQVGIVINDSDPYSVEVGEYYRLKRNIPLENIIHVNLPKKAVVTEAEFASARNIVSTSMPSKVEAIAVAWVDPYRVNCYSTTAAFTLGVPACPGHSNPSSNYYNKADGNPKTDYGMRISMMLAAPSVVSAKAMIDRGIASDSTNPTGTAYFLNTSDKTRSLRVFDSSQIVPFITKTGSLVDARILNADNLTNKNDVMFYFAGTAQVSNIASNKFLPGAMADHLTSYGGQLSNSSQMSILAWIDGGATGSYGTVVEPYAMSAKFPNVAIATDRYLKGDTLIEAYWKSVEKPSEGIFVGEPLARPYNGKFLKITNSYGVQAGVNQTFVAEMINADIDNYKWTMPDGEIVYGQSVNWVPPNSMASLTGKEYVVSLSAIGKDGHIFARNKLILIGTEAPYVRSVFTKVPELLLKNSCTFESPSSNYTISVTNTKTEVPYLAAGLRIVDTNGNKSYLYVLGKEAGKRVANYSGTLSNFGCGDLIKSVVDNWKAKIELITETFEQGAEFSGNIYSTTVHTDIEYIKSYDEGAFLKPILISKNQKAYANRDNLLSIASLVYPKYAKAHNIDINSAFSTSWTATSGLITKHSESEAGIIFSKPGNYELLVNVKNNISGVSTDLKRNFNVLAFPGFVIKNAAGSSFIDAYKSKVVTYNLVALDNSWIPLDSTFSWSFSPDASVISKTGMKASVVYSNIGAKPVVVTVDDSHGNKLEVKAVSNIYAETSPVVNAEIVKFGNFNIAPKSVYVLLKPLLIKQDLILSPVSISIDDGPYSYSKLSSNKTEYFKVNTPGDHSIKVKGVTKLGFNFENTIHLSLGQNVKPTCSFVSDINRTSSRFTVYTVTPTCTDVDGKPKFMMWSVGGGANKSLSNNKVILSLPSASPKPLIVFKVIDDLGLENSYPISF